MNFNNILKEVSEIETANKWYGGLKKLKRKVCEPILPIEGERNILITSALPYVNNIPHLGNIIGCVLSADLYARYCRLRGYQTLYICGTDEYGTATETKALEEKLSCKEICDKYHKIHSDIYKWFNISFDYFGRTTTEQQTKISQDIFLKIRSNGYLIEETVNQLYCENCSSFLADRYVEGTCQNCKYENARGDQCDKCGKLINPIELINPKCKLCKCSPIVKDSKHLFLDLNKLTVKLEEFIEKSHSNGKWSQNAYFITKGWLKEGLKPRCITRDLKWGTSVPIDEYKNKVFYVWFDAPIGYISITANYTDEWEKWWKNSKDVKLVNFMAKDNVPFHTVIFPASLIAAEDNYILLSDISSTEYLNYENEKFSKSRGIGVFGDNAMNSNIESDIFRLYLLAIRPECHDASFNWDDLISRNNNEFISNIGNFINRSLSLLCRKFDGKVQKVFLTPIEIEYIQKIDTFLTHYIDSIENYRFRDGYNNLCEISHLANQYFQTKKPWEFKMNNEDEIKELGSCLSFSLNIVALISLLLQPYAPTISNNIIKDIFIEEEKQVIPDSFVEIIPEGIKINKPKIYINKIDPNQAKILRQKYSLK